MSLLEPSWCSRGLIFITLAVQIAQALPGSPVHLKPRAALTDGTASQIDADQCAAGGFGKLGKLERSRQPRRTAGAADAGSIVGRNIQRID